MKILDIPQNTKEWLTFRRNKIGGSDAPNIMNIGYKTPYQTYMEKLGLYEQPLTPTMQKGHELESLARLHFENKFGLNVTPCVVEHDIRSWQIASLDGLADNGNTFIEIKTGGEAARERARAGKVSDTNYCQVQHQLEVTGLKECLLYFFDGIDGYPIEIKRDDRYIECLNAAEEKFWRDLQDFKSPPLTEKDKKVHETQDRLRMAKEWIELTERMKQDEERKKNLQEELLKECGYQNTIGFGVQAVKVIRSGSIDYSAIPELKEVDLNKYRKAPTEYWRFSSC